MTFDQNHLYSKSLIDDEYNNLFNSISLYYGDILKENYTIKFEASSSPIKGPITRVADSSTAISPTIDQEVYHPIHITCSMYEYTNKKTKEVDTFMKGEMRVEGHKCVFYVEDASSEKRKLYPIRFESKKEWENAMEKGEFTLSLNCPSKPLFTAYSNRLGSDIRGIDEARGVLMRMFGCFLGKPSWDKESMGSQRNAGYFNVIVDMLSKNTANTYFGLKSNKHNSDLLDSHPIIRNFIGKIVKGVIDNYTNYKISTSTTGVKVWDSDKVFKQLLGKPISRPAPPVANNDDLLTLINEILVSDEAPVSEVTAVQDETPSEGSDVDSDAETVEAVVEVAEPVVEVVEVAEVKPAVVEVKPALADVAEPVAAVVAVVPVQQSETTLPNHKVGDVRMATGLVFTSSIDGTLSMIDNSNVVCRILSVGHGAALKTYFESVKSIKGDDYVKGLVKSMSDYMGVN
jgi:hypothetical protein